MSSRDCKRQTTNIYNLSKPHTRAESTVSNSVSRYKHQLSNRTHTRHSTEALTTINTGMYWYKLSFSKMDDLQPKYIDLADIQLKGEKQYQYMFSSNRPKNTLWNLQFLNNVIINRTKVLLPQNIGDLSKYWLSCLALWFYCSQKFKLFGFPIFRFWAHLMKVIPETRRPH